LAWGLVDLGHTVGAVVPAPADQKIKKLEQVRLEYYYTNDEVSYGRASNSYIKKPKFSIALLILSAIYKLTTVIKKYNIDIIHAHWAVPMGFVGSICKHLTGCPLVITTHGRDVYINPEAGDIVPTLWYVRPFLTRALRSADKVIAVSKETMTHTIQAGANPDNVTVINNGVDIDRFTPLDNNISPISQRLGISTANKVILTIGTLHPRKGIDVLYRAMPEIQKCIPGIKLVVIGDGPQKEELNLLAGELQIEENVFMLGSIPNTEVPNFIHACDVFVIPSRREPFGIVAIEAMACGKPVIGSRVGGLHEIIEHRRTGILVDPQNEKQLAESIIEVVKDDDYACDLGKMARREVEKNYDWQIVARETAALYWKVIEDNID